MLHSPGRSCNPDCLSVPPLPQINCECLGYEHLTLFSVQYLAVASRWHVRRVPGCESSPCQWFISAPASFGRTTLYTSSVQEGIFCKNTLKIRMFAVLIVKLRFSKTVKLSCILRTLFFVAIKRIVKYKRDCEFPSKNF